MTKPTKVTAWQDSAGVLHTTIEAWRAAELLTLLNQTDGSGAIEVPWLQKLAADLATDQSEALLSILTTGPRARPKARKVAGTTNPRRAVKRATPAEVQTGLKAMRAAVDASGAAGTDVAAEPSVEVPHG